VFHAAVDGAVKISTQPVVPASLVQLPIDPSRVANSQVVGNTTSSPPPLQQTQPPPPSSIQPEQHTTGFNNNHTYGQPPSLEIRTTQAADATAANLGSLDPSKPDAPTLSPTPTPVIATQSPDAAAKDPPNDDRRSTPSGDQSNAFSPPSTYMPTPATTVSTLFSPSLPADSQGGLATETVHNTSAQFSQLNVHESPLQYSTTTARRVDPNAPRPIPDIRDDGEPNEALYECPEARELDYATTWYYLPESPEFLTCSRCYLDYISGTQIASQFEKAVRPNGRCRFNIPRLVDTLVPEAYRTNDTRAIQAYMSKRLNISACKGSVGALGTENITWFRTVLDQPAGFLACEACFEDLVVGTTFESNFMAMKRPQGTEETWSCDICLPFIVRVFKDCRDKSNGWDDFVAASAARLALPACDGKPQPPSSRQWRNLRRPVSNFAICETCYMDQAAITVFSDEFVLLPPGASLSGGSSSLIGKLFNAVQAQPEEQWICGAHSIPVAVAYGAALGRKDFNLFWDAVNAIMRSGGPCPADGIVNGSWYTLAGGCTNFQICSGCYAGVAAPLALSRFFQPVEKASNEKILCDFNPASPKVRQYLPRLAEAIDVGVWSRLSNYIHKWATIPTCPRDDPTPNRVWYGFDDCTICPACYETVIAGSSLDSKIKYRGIRVAGQTMCCMYSNLMRRKWAEALEQGSFDELLRFSSMRLQVWQATIPQIKMMQQMQQLNMVQAMHAGQMSVMYSGMESFSMVAGTNDGNLHGSSTLGWHPTEYGATSAGFQNQMQSRFGQANNSNVWMTMLKLDTQWRAVE
jgi:hypothetical protein